MKSLLTLAALVLAVPAFCADATGTWKGSVETPNGARETTIKLKAEGAKLTGTVSGRQSDSEIKDGKVDGDNVSFSVVRNFGGNEITMKYTGKLAGDEIKFHVNAGEREYDMTAKRQ